MYKVIVDDKATLVSNEQLNHVCFALKCDDKEFTVVYPSGYTGVFKPKQN